MLKDHAVESERRRNNGLLAMGVVGYRCPACARMGDRTPKKTVVMCLFFANSFTEEGVVAADVMVMVTTDARGHVWIDREVQLVTDVQ